MFSLILCKYRCILTTFQWSLMLFICDTIFINLLVQRLRMTSHFLVDSICEKTSLPFFSMPVDRAFHARQNWLIFSISKDGSLGEKHRKNWVISLKHSGFRSFSSCLAKYMHLMGCEGEGEGRKEWAVSTAQNDNKEADGGKCSNTENQLSIWIYYQYDKARPEIGSRWLLNSTQMPRLWK